jgi:hypothetical protein
VEGIQATVRRFFKEALSMPYIVEDMILISELDEL